jgi:hypothetical protein
MCGIPHFVQPPSSWDSAMTRPAAAISATAHQNSPYEASPSLGSALAPNQIRNPAAATPINVIAPLVKPRMPSPPLFVFPTRPASSHTHYMRMDTARMAPKTPISR